MLHAANGKAEIQYLYQHNLIVNGQRGMYRRRGHFLIATDARKKGKVIDIENLVIQ
jgi:hypothetical protein